MAGLGRLDAEEPSGGGVIMKRLPIPVTDHAVLRWLERVEGLDIETLRAAIGRSGAVGAAFGARIVVVSGGKLVVVDGKVVTVLPRDAMESRLGAVESAEPVVSLQAITPRRRSKRRRRR